MLIVPCFIFYAFTDSVLLCTNGISQSKKLIRHDEDGKPTNFPADIMAYSQGVDQGHYLFSAKIDHDSFFKPIHHKVDIWGSIFSQENQQNYASIKQKEIDDQNSRVRNILNSTNQANQATEIESFSYIKSVRSILRRPIFLLTMMTISVIYFVVTGIQFWISDYMITALGASQGIVFTLFSLISITAPTTGVFFGGYISDRLGGYTGEKALEFCLTFALLASLFALPIPFLENF